MKEAGSIRRDVCLWAIVREYFLEGNVGLDLEVDDAPVLGDESEVDASGVRVGWRSYLLRFFHLSISNKWSKLISDLSVTIFTGGQTNGRTRPLIEMQGLFVWKDAPFFFLFARSLTRKRHGAKDADATHLKIQSFTPQKRQFPPSQDRTMPLNNRGWRLKNA